MWLMYVTCYQIDDKKGLTYERYVQLETRLNKHFNKTRLQYTNMSSC